MCLELAEEQGGFLHTLLGKTDATPEHHVPLRLHVGHGCAQSTTGLLRPLNLWAEEAKWLGSGSLFGLVQRTDSALPA